MSTLTGSIVGSRVADAEAVGLVIGLGLVLAATEEENITKLKTNRAEKKVFIGKYICIIPFLISRNKNDSTGFLKTCRVAAM